MKTKIAKTKNVTKAIWNGKEFVPVKSSPVTVPVLPPTSIHHKSKSKSDKLLAYASKLGFDPAKLFSSNEVVTAVAAVPAKAKKPVVAPLKLIVKSWTGTTSEEHEVYHDEIDVDYSEFVGYIRAACKIPSNRAFKIRIPAGL